MKKIFLVLSCVLVLVSCSDTKVNNDDYNKLEKELADCQEKLKSVTKEKQLISDDLLASKDKCKSLIDENKDLKSLLEKHENKTEDSAKINGELGLVEQVAAKDEKVNYKTEEKIREAMCTRSDLLEKYLNANKYYLSNFFFYGGYSTLKKEDDFSIYQKYGYDKDKFKDGSLLGSNNKITKYEDVVAEIKTYFSESSAEKIIKNNFGQVSSLEDSFDLDYRFIVCNDVVFARWFDVGSGDEDEIKVYELADFYYTTIDIDAGVVEGVVEIPVLTYDAFDTGKVNGKRIDKYEVRYLKEDGVWKIDSLVFFY